ncbi:pyruvate kinase [Escherichia coli]
MSRRLRRTKIVTTLGPATDRDNNLESHRGGCQRCTYEFSHGSPEDRKMRADKVREIAAKLGVMRRFWVTSRGPIRVSTFKEGKVFLNIGRNSC